MLADEPVNVGLYRIPFYFFRDVEGKGVDKQGSCGGFTDPAGPEVKQGLLAKLTYRGTVTAFYIIGIYFELGFGIDGRFLADHEVVILLEGVCLLRVLVYEDLAVEDAGGLFKQDTFIELVAETRRLLMVDQGMVVDQLLAGGEVEAVQVCFCMVFFQLCLQVVADNTPAVALYESMGFDREVYRYHYRVR